MKMYLESENLGDLNTNKWLLFSCDQLLINPWLLVLFKNKILNK